jgi:very-short-patch-repair endonuclease
LLVDDDGRETFYVADFYCAESHLVIEVDGSIHDFTRARDMARTKVLENRGLKVLRVMNSEVENNLNDVLDRISKEL